MVLVIGGLKAPIQLSGRGKSCLANIAKPGVFGLGMVSKENFLAYSIQFIFLIKDLYQEMWSW